MFLFSLPNKSKNQSLRNLERPKINVCVSDGDFLMILHITPLFILLLQPVTTNNN